MYCGAIMPKSQHLFWTTKQPCGAGNGGIALLLQSPRLLLAVAELGRSA